MPPRRSDRIVRCFQNRSVRVWRIDVCQILGNRLARDGEAVAVQQTRIEQAAHHHWNAAHTIHIAHHVPTERLNVREQRHLRADAVEVLDVKVDLGFMGDRQQMQDGIGRASEGHDHRDGVLEGLPRDDVARGNAETEQLDHGLTTLACVRVSTAIDGRRSG